MTKRFSFETRVGTIHIVERFGRYQVLFGDEVLGNFQTPEDAACESSRGRIHTPRNGIDVASLGIPTQLSKWRDHSEESN